MDRLSRPLEKTNRYTEFVFVQHQHLGAKLCNKKQKVKGPDRVFVVERERVHIQSLVGWVDTRYKLDPIFRLSD